MKASKPIHEIKKPEYHDHDEFQNRQRKLNELIELGINPYPHKFPKTDSITEIATRFEKQDIGHSEDAAEGKTPRVTVAGRLVLFRPMGKNAFGHIQGESGRIQIMFNRDITSVEGYTPDPEMNADAMKPLKLIDKMIDLGDIIGVEGHLFRTNKGELTVFVHKLTLLCKTLLPLADKHSGLSDVEIRYRKRWLDLISNEETRQLFRKRSLIMHKIRDYMDKMHFIEVETPVLQSIYGGAEAKPFETELHALHQHMFMRISLEIPLKKLIIGGMNRVYELGKVFRNEGIDRNHNPEFTLFEAYASYWDYYDMMAFVENLVEYLAIELHGKPELTVEDPVNERTIKINVKTPWPKMTMYEAIKKYGNLNVDEMTDDEMKKLLLESEHCSPEKLDVMGRGLLIAAIFEVFAEPYLIQPHHIIDHPIETTPLCKLHRDPKKREQGLVERFESFILGQELCNAYSELNDPVLQRELLEQQASRRERGDEEASPLDEEFIEAICQGMPPTSGVGIGVDRLIMLLTNSHSIRDVLYFPWMKPMKEIETLDEVADEANES